MSRTCRWRPFYVENSVIQCYMDLGETRREVPGRLLCLLTHYRLPRPCGLKQCQHRRELRAQSVRITSHAQGHGLSVRLS